MDFDRWMRQQAPAAEPAPKPETRQDKIDVYADALEEADVLRRDGQGGYLALCCKCDCWTELYCGPEEVDINYEHYCGGSPYCCP